MTTRLMMMVLGAMVMMVGPVASQTEERAPEHQGQSEEAGGSAVGPNDLIDCIVAASTPAPNLVEMGQCVVDFLCAQCFWCVSYDGLPSIAPSGREVLSVVREWVVDPVDGHVVFEARGPAPFSMLRSSSSGTQVAGHPTTDGVWGFGLSRYGDVPCA